MDAGPAEVVSLTANPNTLQLEVGATQTIMVVANLSDSTSRAAAEPRFTSSSQAVATVDAAGVVTAVAEGMASIGIMAEGRMTSATVTVVPAGGAVFPVVFGDQYASGVTFQDFGGATNAVSVDTAEFQSGTASLKVEVPAAGYTGGALKLDAPVSLSSYNALSFWAKASDARTLNVAGLGNDATASTWSTERNAIGLTTTWTRFLVPIPNPQKATSVAGVFHFAEGADEGAYTIWFDDIRYESVPPAMIGNPRPAIATMAVTRGIGESFAVMGTALTVELGGADVGLATAPSYFDFTSSDTGVATVDTAGVVTTVAAGTTAITGQLAGVAAAGMIDLTVAALGTPTEAAPTPTDAAADVISLFSDAYTDRTVDTFSAVWDMADVADDTAGGNAVKRYSNLSFAGIEFTSNQIDATNMTHFRMDVWTPNATELRIKLVDFGPNGVFQGGDDSEHELIISAGSLPALSTGQWVTLDLELSRFTGLTARANLAQLVITGAPSGATTLYVDNIILRRGAVTPPAAPTTAAPTPSLAAADVISLYSNAYTNRTVDTWSAVWDMADVADVTIAGDDMKRYTNLSFAGVEFTSNQIDASAMTHLHMDVWTPNLTQLRIKLVDFGPNAVFQGGDDTEHELIFDANSTPALITGQWLSLDLPLASFTGLTNRANLAQLVISAMPTGTELYVDNVYLHR